MRIRSANGAVLTSSSFTVIIQLFDCQPIISITSTPSAGTLFVPKPATDPVTVIESLGSNYAATTNVVRCPLQTYSLVGYSGPVTWLVIDSVTGKITIDINAVGTATVQVRVTSKNSAVVDSTAFTVTVNCATPSTTTVPDKPYEIPLVAAGSTTLVLSGTAYGVSASDVSVCPMTYTLYVVSPLGVYSGTTFLTYTALSTDIHVDTNTIGNKDLFFRINTAGDPNADIDSNQFNIKVECGNNSQSIAAHASLASPITFFIIPAVNPVFPSYPFTLGNTATCQVTAITIHTNDVVSAPPANLVTSADSTTSGAISSNSNHWFMTTA